MIFFFLIGIFLSLLGEIGGVYVLFNDVNKLFLVPAIITFAIGFVIIGSCLREVIL